MNPLIKFKIGQQIHELTHQICRDTIKGYTNFGDRIHQSGDSTHSFMGWIVGWHSRN